MGLLYNCYQSARLWLRRSQTGLSLIHKTKLVHLFFWRLFCGGKGEGRLTRAQADGLLGKPVTIFTTDYCMFVARVYAHHLRKMGLAVSITTEQRDDWDDGLHLLVSAQLVQHLPKHYVVVQMEQLTVSTWYGVHYHRILLGADAVFDYCRSNLEFLRRYNLGGVPLHFMPITILGNEKIQPADTPRKYDVLFYGGWGHHRRQNAIAKLQEHYNVEVITNLFGEELHEALRSAKIIINIHQYDHALIETTRLFECLSLGLFVVSEDSSNSGDFPTLRENVSWFDEGDWEGMIAEVGKWLADNKAREEERVRRYARALEEADSFTDCFRTYLEAHEG